MSDGRLPPFQVSDVPGALWPPVQTGLNASVAALARQMELTERLPLSDIQAGQDRQLRALLAHFAAQSPQFQARLKAAGLAVGDVAGVSKLSRLPVLTRRDIQSAGPAFYCAQLPQAHERAGETKTSGSTGEPVTVTKTRITMLFSLVYTLRNHAWNGRDMTGRVFSIRANIARFGWSDDWGVPVAPLFESGKLQGMPISADIGEQAKHLAAFQPHMLIIYPTALEALLDLWGDGGSPLENLQHIKTLGETVSDRLRSKARSVVGLELEDVYSSQEMGTIAMQCPEGGQYHVMSESVIAEVLDENDRPCGEGEVGRLVLTDLQNFASPLIRYDIGDYAEVGGPCACGRTLPTLKRILGRERNLVRHADGRRHWPLVGFHDFDTVAPVRQYQMVQTSLQDIEFRVVTDEPLSGDQESGLIAIAQKALGDDFRFILVQSRERLPRGRSGKFEEFICAVRE